MRYTSNEQILASDYIDILYAGHNKNYGGYELRKNYSRRMVTAITLLIVVALLGSGFSILFAGGSVETSPKNKPIVLTNIHPVIIPPPVTPPPPAAIKPPKASTQNTTPPVVTPDNNVIEKELPVENGKVTNPGLENTAGDPDAHSNPTDSGTGNTPVAPAMPKPPGEIHKYVDLMPTPAFDITEFLSKNLRYPDMARETGLQGRVVIRFVVNEDGTISEVQLVKGIGPACDAEALRVVAAMPHWKPGRQNGVPVRVYYTLPIVFELD